MRLIRKIDSFSTVKKRILLPRRLNFSPIFFLDRHHNELQSNLYWKGALNNIMKLFYKTQHRRVRRSYFHRLLTFLAKFIASGSDDQMSHAKFERVWKIIFELWTRTETHCACQNTILTLEKNLINPSISNLINISFNSAFHLTENLTGIFN